MGTSSNSNRGIKKIFTQIEQNICKIYTSQNYIGTGFLCKMPYPDEFNFLPVLISNNHFFKKEDLLENKTIKLSFNNGKIIKIIIITPQRKIYHSKEYDVNIIEIFPIQDDIHDFLTINEDLNVDKKEIYNLQYLEENKSEAFYGKIKNVNNFEISFNIDAIEIRHEGPIMLLDNLKVIGIHTENNKKSNINFGTLLQYPIKELYPIFKNLDEEKQKKILELKKQKYLTNFYNNNDDNDYINSINIIFRECGKAKNGPIIIKCSLNENIKNVIKRYKKVLGYESGMFIYNGFEITNSDLSVEELGIINRHTIFVIKILN